MIYPDVASRYIGQPQERGRAAAGRRQAKGLAWGPGREGIIPGRAGLEAKRYQYQASRWASLWPLGRECLYTFQSHVCIAEARTGRVLRIGKPECIATVQRWIPRAKVAGEWQVHHAEVGVEARQDGVGLLAGGSSKQTAATCVGACGHTRGKSFATNHQAMEVACWIG
jgi:hypothetical protein